MERVLIKGATSFIGLNILPYILDAGYEAYVLVRKTSQLITVLQNKTI